MSPMGLMSPIGRKNRAWELAVVRFLAQSIESIESIESIIVHRVHRLAVKTKHENDGKYEKYVLGQGCPKYKARKARKARKAIVQNVFAVAPSVSDGEFLSRCESASFLKTIMHNCPKWFPS